MTYARFVSLSLLLVLPFAFACATDDNIDPVIDGAADASGMGPPGSDSGAVDEQPPSPRAAVNFAFGGATTNSANAMDAFATEVPQLGPLLDNIRSAGLNVIGLSQQLDFARRALNDVDAAHDLFWVYAGINNFLSGATDPQAGVDELMAALESLYADVGARRFMVPNLPSLAALPLYAGEDETVRAQLSVLSQHHNVALASALASFRETHVDATVSEVDVHAIFEAHVSDGVFLNPSVACDSAVPAEELAKPGACDGYLFLDIVHPSTSAWTPVAEAAAAALEGIEIKRVITLGDSFSDRGALSDTFQRTVGFAFPMAPFTEGRYTDAANIIELLESRLAVDTITGPFAQPFAFLERFEESGASSLDATSLFVPKMLAVESPGSAKSVSLRFSNEADASKVVVCLYEVGVSAGASLTGCSSQVRGGDVLEATHIELSITDAQGAATEATVLVDWLHYRA